jgi:hypothetical protein
VPPASNALCARQELDVLFVGSEGLGPKRLPPLDETLSRYLAVAAVPTVSALGLFVLFYRPVSPLS